MTQGSPQASLDVGTLWSRPNQETQRLPFNRKFSEKIFPAQITCLEAWESKKACILDALTQGSPVTSLEVEILFLKPNYKLDKLIFIIKFSKKWLW